MADESQPRADCVTVDADPDEGMDPGTGSYTVEHFKVFLGILHGS